MGHPDFRVNNRIFASLNAEQTVGTVKLTADEQQEFVDRDKTVFVPAAGAWGLQGWTKVHLAAADAESVGEALTLAFQGMSAQPAAKPRKSKSTSRPVASRTKAAPAARAADAAKSPKKSPAPAARAAKPAAVASRVKSAATATEKRTGKVAPAAAPASRLSAKRASAAAAATAVIDDYIARCEPAVRPIMNAVRDLVRTEVPSALEKFSYRMPAFEMNGMLIFYAPFKNHLGIFPPVKGDAALDKALAPYRGEKGNLRFPFDRPIPYPLIRRVVRARVKQNQARLKSR